MAAFGETGAGSAGSETGGEMDKGSGAKAGNPAGGATGAARLTAGRRLHADRPFWAATPHIRVAAAPGWSEGVFDAVIVGTGISGALMADALADGRRRVLVVDRRRPVRGSTLASTAMIQHEIDLPLFDLARRIGRAKAERAWRRSVRAVADLGTRIADLGIACDFRPKQALYLAGDSYGGRALALEAEARTAAGIAHELLPAAMLRERFGLDRTAAILSSASASANPAQMTAGLLRAALARGAELAAQVEITDLDEAGGRVALATATGRLILARQVVFCTGYEFLPCMQSRAHRITSTWALASAPGVPRPGWLDDMLVWEGSDPYLYFRSTRDGRIIAGGEDEDDPEAYRDPARMRRNLARICEKLADLTGISISPAYGWAAPFGNTTDGLPIIDRIPGMDLGHAVMGFGGNGITYSMIAAQIVAARIAGRADPDEDLFRFR